MQDLTNPVWIKAKGVLFLLAGLLAGSLLVLEHPSLKTVALLSLSVWCFCRFYYFAFYVIEHYIDRQFKFTGLGSAVMYLLNTRNR